MLENILRKFPNTAPPPEILKTHGSYFFTKNAKILDTTAGWTSYATLGFNNKELIKALNRQLKKFSHIDYNIWTNPEIQKLSKEISFFSNKKLSKVYFSGCSGSEAVEAALKLSLQVHFNNGNKNKKIIISRTQSFHGATMQAISCSDIPLLDIFQMYSNPLHHKIHQHNPYHYCRAVNEKKCVCKKNPSICMGKFKNENNTDYLNRSIKYFEDKITEIGSENIASFIGETQLGSLVGDVPAIKGYWEKIEKICKKNNIHLILDEVYCGIGRSGEFFNFTNDEVEPDFVCCGKNTTSGIVPLSFVLAKSAHQKSLSKDLGRIRIGHTFQGFSLGIAVCRQLIKIIKRDKLLDIIKRKGKYMRSILETELKNNTKFKNIRGRGLMFSLEHNTNDNVKFSQYLYKNMLSKNILINSKWHRTSFTPSFLIEKKEVDRTLDYFINFFKKY
jgi:adenosylmethionine-8-amino-7-oxononanoate aminotransferase